ncbi:MAG: hypothetical protein U5K69_10540 [Balneolaceae bacterium]|nr:hypothetical protein [Balneolaceae bacterium]
MSTLNPSLGLCFFDNQLFYAVDNPEKQAALARIGSVDFNFDLPAAILQGDKEYFPAVQAPLSD